MCISNLILHNMAIFQQIQFSKKLHCFFKCTSFNLSHICMSFFLFIWFVSRIPKKIGVLLKIVKIENSLHYVDRCFYLRFGVDYGLCFFIYGWGWDKRTLEIDSMVQFLKNEYKLHIHIVCVWIFYYYSSHSFS